jgi:hypothetical protein
MQHAYGKGKTDPNPDGKPEVNAASPPQRIGGIGGMHLKYLEF